MKRYLIKITVILSFLLLPALAVLASPPLDFPPDPGGDPGPGGTPVGGAPIGDGLIVLLALGAAYGGWKLYRIKKHDSNESLSHTTHL